MISWPLTVGTGWGIYGTNLTLELLKTPTYQPILLAGLSNLELMPQTQQQQLKAVLSSQSSIHQPLDFPILCALGNQFNTSEFVANLKSPQKIGLIFFEDTHFTPEAINVAKTYKQIITGSTWNTTILKQYGLTEVYTIFQGINPTLFYPAPKTGKFANRFVIFSGGKLEYRKGQDIVIAAFKAFHRRHPDAVLVTMWHNYWPQFMQGLEQAGYVVGIPAVTTEGQLQVQEWLIKNGIPSDAVVDAGLIPNHLTPQLLRDVDVAVFTNRGEGGTNLVAMECLACGIPTILSANTGHLDLIHPQHCYPLQQQSAVTPMPPYSGVEGWGESDVEEVVETLEQVYQNRSEAQSRGAAAVRWMEDWTWEKQIQRLLHQITL
ncbi:MAG: glycosyltransferase family 4 protein [Microcoleaceae cyanobacterium]